MTESPAELLERAASLIEEYAADATPGPWFYNGRITFQTGGHMLETEDRKATPEERSAVAPRGHSSLRCAHRDPR